jgi:hypothetical protein
LPNEIDFPFANIGVYTYICTYIPDPYRTHTVLEYKKVQYFTYVHRQPRQPYGPRWKGGRGIIGKREI